MTRIKAVVECFGAMTRIKAEMKMLVFGAKITLIYLKNNIQ